MFCLCLQEKSGTIQHYQSLMAKKQREYQQSLEKSKTFQTEQQHRLEMVQQHHGGFLSTEPQRVEMCPPSASVFYNDRLLSSVLRVRCVFIGPVHIKADC